MIIINDKLLENVYKHVREDYPYECCGLLTGKNTPKKVLGVHPVTNLNKDRAHDRYELDPKEFERIDNDARAAGLSILGFYHSHPDHPSAPSEFDTQAAWEVYQFTQEIYSYVIVAVENGEKVKATSWILNEQGVFNEEQILNELGERS